MDELLCQAGELKKSQEKYIGAGLVCVCVGRSVGYVCEGVLKQEVLSGEGEIPVTPMVKVWLQK